MRIAFYKSSFLCSVSKRNKNIDFLTFSPYARDKEQTSICLLMMLTAPPASLADSICFVDPKGKKYTLHLLKQ